MPWIRWVSISASWRIGLEQAGWVQAKAARLLGMTPRQVAYRIQTLNIKVRRI